MPSVLPTEAIWVAGLAKSYRSGSVNRTVLKNLDLSVAAGERIAIVGRSGSGKSTLLRIVGGLDDDFEGEAKVSVGGESFVPSEARKRRVIGFAFQRPTLFPWLNALENILQPLRVHANNRDWTEAMKYARSLIDRVGLGGYESSFPHQLSGGMQSRVAVVRALVQQPRVLLLDEPSAALDEVTRLALDATILGLFEHNVITTIVVTHIVEEAIDLASRIVILGGTPARLSESFAVAPAVRTNPIEKMALIGKIRESIRSNGETAKFVTGTNEEGRPG